MAAESAFERLLIRRLMELYPGAVILKNDANNLQGFPDRTILWRDRWACLEVKASGSSPHQPNQDYYVDLLNHMSYSSFVYPSNLKDVLHGLQLSFRAQRPTRLLER